MKTERLPFNRRTWDSFVLNLKLFATSVQVGRKAKWMFAALILFLLGINALNVLAHLNWLHPHRGGHPHPRKLLTGGV